MLLSALFYFISFCAQGVAAIYAVNLYLRSKSYRLAFGFLALALCLMLGRRVAPLVHVLNYGHVDLPDALLSVPISLLLLLGFLQLKKVLIDLEKKNFTLAQINKVDALTGAISRPEAFARIEIEVERSLRTRESIAFLMLDIDHFKKVNDAYGHPVGDLVLMSLVKHCQEELRVIDIFGRVGGEEFLIALPETNMDQALDVAQRVRQHVAKTSCTVAAGKKIFITVSIGVAVFDPLADGETVSATVLEKYYSLSDQAMYAAKQGGRNRVEFIR
jgi:diguanylate cyclase (GGDEF)-like protein